VGEKAVYIGLVHHPVLDRSGRVITTAVTNMDLHDMARLSRTYGLKGYYVVQPLELQRRLVERLTNYWKEGRGKDYNPTRRDAFERLRLVPELSDAIDEIEAEQGKRPIVVGTSARQQKKTIKFDDLRPMMKKDGPWLILFGTGWGVEPGFLEEATDHIVEPIRAGSDYNHLSVRTAAAIALDRLIGEE